MIKSVDKAEKINEDTLHISKGDLILERDGILNSIYVLDVSNSLTEAFKTDDCMPLISALLKNKIIIQNLIGTIEFLTSKSQNDISYSFSDAKTVFFDCNQLTLRGFCETQFI